MATFTVTRRTSGGVFQLYRGGQAWRAQMAFERAKGHDHGQVTYTEHDDFTGERKIVAQAGAFTWDRRCPCVCTAHGNAKCGCPCPRHPQTTGFRG